MADGKVKWGVLGSGGIARLRTIPEGIVNAGNAELAAVYDINTAVNKEVAEQFGAAAVESMEALLAEDVEAVYIATPAYQHYEQVLACAKAGKNVLCEKPLGLVVVQAEKMIAACDKAGVLLGTAFMMRFQTQNMAALKMIEDGDLGRPVFARAQLSCWYPQIEGAWRQDPALGGGGSLMDLGGHCIDLLEMFFGRIEKVSCFINNSVHDYKSEDSAVAMLFFENGAMASVDTLFCVPDASSKNRLEIYGSKGSILAEGTIGQGQAGKMTAYIDDAGKGYDAKQVRTEAGGVEISPEPVNTYKAEIEEFSNAVLQGSEPANSAAIGLESQRVLEACYESARTGKTITV